MKIIEFFGLQVKPRITKGKRMFKPMETGFLSPAVAMIRDRDVNCFLIRTDHGFLAIDSGYKNSVALRRGLQQLNIPAQQVHTVFLTHLDIDHAGGMDLDSEIIFPDAEVYLSETENEYLKGTVWRKSIGPIHCSMPVRLSDKRKLLKEGETVDCDGVRVRAVSAPGHSYGHTAYHIGNDLFVGDCMISDQHEGWCFYDFWNWDTEINKKTLLKLKAYCEKEKITHVITSHSGCLSPSTAFVHWDEYPEWKKKGFHLISDAEDDPYHS